jgi:hypothetical protein
MILLALGPKTFSPYPTQLRLNSGCLVSIELPCVGLDLGFT